jgi:hypothetical protein
MKRWKRFNFIDMFRKIWNSRMWDSRIWKRSKINTTTEIAKCTLS